MPTAAVIVAHPDDEALWCGGFMLARPEWDWFVLILCRSSDTDRAARFERALKYLGAKGAIADLDDGAEQTPLNPSAIRHVIREGLPRSSYDYVFTHGPAGEYTRHLRHEECCRAVVSLWVEGQLVAGKLKFFAYDDLNGTTLPRAVAHADERHQLAPQILQKKRHLITNIYGFAEQSWEARTTPEVEGFIDIDSLSKFESLQAQKPKSRTEGGGVEGRAVDRHTPALSQNGDAAFASAPLDGAPFASAPFDSSPLDGAPFDSAQFDSSPLDGAQFDSAQHDSAQFDSAQHDGAQFDGVQNDSSLLMLKAP